VKVFTDFVKKPDFLQRNHANYNIDDSENSMSVRLERLLRLMEADDMVKMTKICHYCGATSLYRRVRKVDTIVIYANKLSIILQ
jgi:hypothetical protein